jgi:hypothetical protein
LQQKDQGNAFQEEKASEQASGLEALFGDGKTKAAEQETNSDNSSSGTNDNQLQKAEQPVILKIRFDIYQLKAKGEFFSQSGGVWKFLNEESIPATTAEILRLNGLRVAKGETSTWPAIKDLLEKEEVTTSSSTRTVNNALPLEIKMDSVPQDQTLFLYRRDKTLAGFPYRNCTNYLRIEFAIPLDDLDCVDVEVMPEIRLPQRRSKPKLTINGWVYPEPEKPRRIFRELSFNMRIEPKEFFVLGPSGRAKIDHLAGGLFLCSREQDQRMESMFVIMPQVIREDNQEE